MTFTSNTSGKIGGALYFYAYVTAERCQLEVRDSFFDGNKAGTDGGAIGSSTSLPGTGIITGTTFTDNEATRYGGAIYQNFEMEMESSSVTGNRASDGGGIYVSSRGNRKLSVAKSEFCQNTAAHDGGAFHVSSWGGVEDTVVSGNVAGNAGGGAYMDADITLTNMKFIGNTAEVEGGAVCNMGTASISASTFSGNTAGVEGGAVCNMGTASISASTFSGNTAGTCGGAIYNIGYAEIADSSFVTETDGIYNDATVELYGTNTLNAQLSGGTAGVSYSGEDTVLHGGGTVAQRYIAQGYTTSWDGVALDATMIGGKVDKAVEEVNLNFHDVAMSAGSLVFGAGECVSADIGMGSKTVNLSFTGTGTREKAYIYAGGHASGNQMSVGDVNINCDVTGDMGALWGGALLENGGSFAAGTVSTEIGGGRFLSYVGNGCKTVGGGADGTVNTQITKTSLSITGGSFTNLVYAGGYSNGNGVTVGSSTLEISGGTFAKSVFGGNGANSNENGTKTIVTGSVTVTVDASAGDRVSFGGNLYAGSMGEGAILGTTTMTFKGNGENLSFSESSYVSGGSKLAYHYAYAQKTFVKGNADRDARFLVFDGFSGDFGANMNNGFSNVSFVNGSSGIGFTAGNVDLRYTKAWDFEIGGDGTILSWQGGMNDFAGDSISLSFADGYVQDSTPAVLLAGDAGTLNGWKKAEITLGGSAMTDDDGDGIFTGSCAGVDYRLYEDAEHRLLLAIA
ncbi:MAG: hypothetical protein MJ202_05350 [Lentisphaeria bacterium]|nr:hypothetical protein [Lentisphaeria bacterium]